MAADKLELAREALQDFFSTKRSSDFFADDFVFDFSGFRGWIEDSEYHGREGFDEQFARWTEPFENWTAEIAEVRDAGGDDVLILGTQRGSLRGSGETVEMALAQLGTIRDGKLRLLRIFATIEDACDAAGVEPTA